MKNSFFWIPFYLLSTVNSHAPQSKMVLDDELLELNPPGRI